MNHYDEMFRRKSVRSYDMRPLSQEHIDRINSWRTWVVPYCDYVEIQNHIRLITDADVTGLFSVKAPAYIVYTSINTPLSGINAGFILMQIAMELSAMGIGCCFLGGAKPDAKHLEGLRYPYVITLCCGYGKEEIHRSVSEFKRKAANKVCEGIGVESLMEAIRLAPSGMNRQPWRFISDGGKLHVYAQNAPALLRKMFDALTDIDMGIVLYYIKVAIEQEGHSITFDSIPRGRELETKGRRYITTVQLKRE